MAVEKTNEAGLYTGYQNAETAYTQGRNSLLTFDNTMLFIIIGLSLFVIISSALVFNHPAFLIIGFILLAIAITVSAVISNAWIDLSEDSNINLYSSSFPKVNFIMQRLPYYVIFMGISTSIAMYMGYRREYG